MAKYFSFIAENLTPLSQNNRSAARVQELGKKLVLVNNSKYPTNRLPYRPLLRQRLAAKVFYIHRVPDYKDADNISKPLWDSLNRKAYEDDWQIKYIEALKISLDDFNGDCEFDFTDLDADDFSVLLNFIDDYDGNRERILYVSVSDYQSENVSFI